MNIQITYSPASLAEFKEAVEFMKEQGISASAPVVSRPAAKDEDGPNVAEWKRQTGASRFRLSEGEQALMNSEGLSREDIAQIRLNALNGTLPPVSGSSSLPRPDGLSILDDGE